jgi:hypothetical protein
MQDRGPPADAVGEHREHDGARHPTDDADVEHGGHQRPLDAELPDDCRGGVIDRLVVEAVGQHDQAAQHEDREHEPGREPEPPFDLQSRLLVLDDFGDVDPANH